VKQRPISTWHTHIQPVMKNKLAVQIPSLHSCPSCSVKTGRLTDFELRAEVSWRGISFLPGRIGKAEKRSL
jgi:hypothetical protein